MFESLEYRRRPSLVQEQTALVVVDMINHELRRGEMMLGELEDSGVDVGYYVEQIDSVVIPNHQRLIAACRATGVRVVFLRIGAYSRDFADAIPPLRDMFSRWGAYDGGFACEIDSRLAAAPGDVSLIKTGSGGFATSALDSHLRNMGIRHIFYTGVVTNGCVLLTLAGGYDLGYMGCMVSDATATFSAELQRSTEDIVSGYMAEVVTTETVLGRLGTTETLAASAQAV
jgi:nicotinamidase-related amidase